MLVLGPGSSVVCIKAGTCFCGCSSVTKDAIYFCADIDAGWQAHLMHAMFCDIEGCACITLFVKDKTHGFCINRFKPLNDGDTSLVEDEEEEDDSAISIKRFENV